MADAPTYDGKPDDILSEAQEAFKLCEDRESENREAWLECTQFVAEPEKHQWPEAVRKRREEAGRPCMVIDKLGEVVRQVVNDARQNKPAIKVHPADDKADPKTAELINGLIRNIEVTSRADQAYDTALENAVTGGWGYLRVATEYTDDNSFDLDLRIKRVANPLSIYGDPYSVETDSSDWDTAFEAELLPKKQFEAQYKGADPVDWSEFDGVEAPWCSEDQVMVARYWKREVTSHNLLMLSNGEAIREDVYAEQKAMYDSLGVAVVGQPRPIRSHKVCHYLMTGAEVLEKGDWAGRYIPIVPVYGRDFNVEGRRVIRSLVRNALDAQRGYNFARSSVAELIGYAPKTPFIGQVGSFLTDKHKWDTANQESWPYIEHDGPVPPQRQPFAGVPAGLTQEALNFADDIRTTTGIHQASLGIPSNETSGKAILARQREGDVSTFDFSDNLSRAIEHVGRILIDLIPVVYGPERIIRTLGLDGAVATVPLGKPVVVGQQPAQQQDPATGQMIEVMQDITHIYDLSLGKYDLTVETGPSYTTKREEAAEGMIELMRALPASAVVIGPRLAKALDWEGADEIAAEMKLLQPPQLQGPNAQVEQLKQQASQAMEGLKQQAGQQIGQLQQQVQQLSQQLQETQQDRALENRKLDIQEYEAATKRIEAQAKVKTAQVEALGDLGFMPGAQDQGPMGQPGGGFVG